MEAQNDNARPEEQAKKFLYEDILGQGLEMPLPLHIIAKSDITLSVQEHASNPTLLAGIDTLSGVGRSEFILLYVALKKEGAHDQRRLDVKETPFSSGPAGIISYGYLSELTVENAKKSVRSFHRQIPSISHEIYARTKRLFSSHVTDKDLLLEHGWYHALEQGDRLFPILIHHGPLPAGSRPRECEVPFLDYCAYAKKIREFRR